MRRTLVVVAWMLAGAACGGGSSAPLSPATYGDALRTAGCKQAVRCKAVTDQASCEAQAEAPDMTSIAAAVTAGKITFDATTAQACLTAVAALSCDIHDQDNRVAPAACTQALVGAAADGAACEIDGECASGACTTPSCGSACCGGTCATVTTNVPAGGPCARDSECMVGLWCSAATDGTGGTCTATLPAGMPCFGDDECDFGLGCIGGDGTHSPPGTCGDGPHVGDMCSDSLCADLGASCGSNNLCVAVGLAGATCGPNAPCGELLYCDGSLHCAGFPTLGQPCTTVCSDDSFCLVTAGAGVCTAPLANGMACTQNRGCTSGFCDQSSETGTGTCAADPVCM